MLALLGLLMCRPVWASESVNLAQAQGVFPSADRLAPAGGGGGVMAVSQGARLLGYAWLSHEVANTTGFSGRPINVLVGMDIAGKITGVRIIEHHEPILAIGVSDQRLQDFAAQYVGRDARAATQLGQAGGLEPIAGASVSSLLLNDAILRSARLVARANRLGAARAGEDGARAGLDLEAYEPTDWAGLLADGSVARLTVPEPTASSPTPAMFIDLYAALVTPPRIGRNLLGDVLYSRAMQAMPPGASAILIAASGRYSFKGTAFTRADTFDRIQLVQDNRTIRVRSAWHERVERLRAAGVPELRELGLFTIPAHMDFDPARAWRLELLATRSEAAGTEILALEYRLPARYLRAPPAVASPAVVPAAVTPTTPSAAPAPIVPAESEAPITPRVWEEVWRNQQIGIALLTLMLVALTGVLFAQDAIVARRRLHHAVRMTTLTITLVWLGWFYGAQLSVLNVFTFQNALLMGFRWDMFLLAPFIFVLWSFVALALMFWGRGIFCGWLCPFGALQELSNKIGRYLRLPQWRLPFLLHERLWPIKYVAFVGLLAVSLQGLEQVFVCLEYEPFKTAIVLRFNRPWLYALYPVALLMIGLFVERLFCRYLCPLGAALALPARLRTFEWLRRRRQCGTECQICASRCPVQAIHPEGQINVHECIYCLGCQVNYYDDSLCPPLIERRRRREARAAARATTAGN